MVSHLSLSSCLFFVGSKMEHVVWWALTNVGFLHAIVSGLACFTRGEMLLWSLVGSFLFTPDSSQEKFAVCVYPNITRSVSECWTVTWFRSLLVDRAVYCFWCKLKPVRFAGRQESYHEWMVADTAPKQLNVAENIGSQYRKAWRYHCCWENCSCRNTVEILSVSLRASNRCLCR